MIAHLMVFYLSLSRGERDPGGGESSSPESPRGSRLCSWMQFFYHRDKCAVVPTESWVSLIRLFYLASGTRVNRRLKSTFDSKECYSTLHIGGAQLQDSGTYLCASDAQCFQHACGLAPNCSWVCIYSADAGRVCRTHCTAVGS